MHREVVEFDRRNLGGIDLEDLPDLASGIDRVQDKQALRTRGTQAEGE